MALQTTALKERLNQLYDEQATRETDPAKARSDFVDGLVNAFEAWLKSGTLAGTVSIAGTAAAQTGTITSGTIQ